MKLVYRCAQFRNFRKPIVHEIDSMHDFEEGATEFQRENVVVVVRMKGGGLMELLVTHARTVYLLPSHGGPRRLVGIDGEVA